MDKNRLYRDGIQDIDHMRPIQLSYEHGKAFLSLVLGNYVDETIEGKPMTFEYSEDLRLYLNEKGSDIHIYGSFYNGNEVLMSEDNMKKLFRFIKANELGFKYIYT